MTRGETERPIVEEHPSPIPYSEEFYENQGEGARRSADVVLGALYEHMSPESVLDVGCGRGHWLAAAAALGSTRLVGVEGRWVQDETLADSHIELVTMDLEHPASLDEKFDLCLSLEVAEHLPADSEERFVDFLCTTSNVVVFSAAIPGQGGTHHVNEAWQSHWVSLFAERGYDCVDLIRQEIWHDERVEWWYRQNTLVYVNYDSATPSFPRLEGTALYDVVHPAAAARLKALERQVVKRRQDPPIGDCLDCLKNWIRGRIRC